MEFFEVVSRRRSVRKYTNAAVPPEAIAKAIDAAILAPNSSNMQTWRMYWVRSPEKKQALVTACLNQGSARSAQELVVFAVDSAQWKISRDLILKEVMKGNREDIKKYYANLMPFFYGWRWLVPIKYILFNTIGLFKPIVRGPTSLIGINQTCIKSAALACENFMLAIAAQGFDSCPMEGFDSVRVKRALGLSRSSRIVMVISVGERDERGIWGERFRIPREIVVHEV
jgi:nitroreductase